MSLYYYPDQDERNVYVVDVVNGSPLPIYAHLFILDPDYSVVRLYPRSGEQEAGPPGATLSVGLGQAAELLRLKIGAKWEAGPRPAPASHFAQ